MFALQLFFFKFVFFVRIDLTADLSFQSFAITNNMLYSSSCTICAGVILGTRLRIPAGRYHSLVQQYTGIRVAGTSKHILYSCCTRTGSITYHLYVPGIYFTAVQY